MRHKTWALITNGERARILRDIENQEAGAALERVSKAQAAGLRDDAAERAGRSFASDASGRRSALVPGSDPEMRDMQDFARETLGFLDGHLRTGHLTRLAIFAAPKMLGVLRDEMPETLAAAVMLERDQNLINLPEADLRQTVVAALKAGAP